ncbi:MAG: hypothetical protein WC551_01760 [Patescibacteria group bacterium]
MPYNPNTARVSPEAGAEAEKRRNRDENLEITPEERAKTAEMRERDESESQEKVAEIHAALSLEQLQRKLGIKKLKDPEAMLHAVILDRDVTPGKLEAVKNYMESVNQSLIQSLSSNMEQGQRVKTQRKIEANFNLIAKVEDAIHVIENEAKDKDDASRILNRELMRDMNMEQGAADAIFNLENEQAGINAEQDGLEKKVAELTGGMSPSEYMEDLRNRSTGLPMIGHRARAWFAKISGSENLQSMVEKWRENNRRLTQLESNLLEIKPPKTEQAPMYTPVSGEVEYEQVQPEDVIEEIEHLGPEDMIKAPRPMTREEMAQPGVAAEQSRKATKLIEGQLKKLEARKAEIDEELALIEPQIKDYLGRLSKNLTKQEAIVYNQLKKTRDALRAEAEDIAAKSLKLMSRMPKPIAEEAPEISDEEIEEVEPVSAVRRKARATPPPAPESPAVRQRKEEERMRREAEEAFEARKKQEADMEAQAEYNKNVNKSKEILGEARAAEIMDGVFTQMGLRLTGEEINNKEQLWGKANQEQRLQAVNFVFKCSDRQAAIIAGETRLQKKIEKELENMAKAMGIDAKLAYEISGHAGAGVAFETGARQEQARTGGVTVSERARTKARRTVNEAPAILGITKEQAEAEEMLESAIAAEEARSQAETEEKLMAGAKAAKEVVAKNEDNLALPPEIMLQAEVGKRMMSPMNIEGVYKTIKQSDASELWNLAVQKMEEKPKAEKVLSGLKDGKEQNPATLYVMAMARYLEAANEPAPTEVVKAFAKRVEDANKALGLEGNALVQSVMRNAERTFGKAAGRNNTRGKETTAQQARKASRY